MRAECYNARMDTSQQTKLLYVEDDPGLATIYKFRLEAEGFKVMHCDRGQKAVEQGREFKPDVILLDLMMPEMSGFEALEIFRKTPETAKAKIIIMSALSRAEDIDKTKALGGDDYLVKSQVTIDDVIASIHHHAGTLGSSTPPTEQSAPAVE
jgi:DNA-binding response OmpR family regulator